MSSLETDNLFKYMDGKEHDMERQTSSRHPGDVVLGMRSSLGISKRLNTLRILSDILQESAALFESNTSLSEMQHDGKGIRKWDGQLGSRRCLV